MNIVWPFDKQIIFTKYRLFKLLAFAYSNRMNQESIKTTSLNALADHLANDDFTVLKIDHYFGLEPHASNVRHILQNYTPMLKDCYTDYRALGLQYANEDNPLYDVVQSLNYLPTDGKVVIRPLKNKAYIKKNVLGEFFPEFFNFFETDVYLQRGRILIAEPGHTMQTHTDGACTGTIHFVVQTNPESFLIVDEIPYHIPADGYFYILNTGRPHRVENRSKVDDRIHITFPINPACFKTLTQAQYDSMQRYFKQFGINPSIYTHIKITP